MNYLLIKACHYWLKRNYWSIDKYHYWLKMNYPLIEDNPYWLKMNYRLIEDNLNWLHEFTTFIGILKRSSNHIPILLGMARSLISSSEKVTMKFYTMVLMLRWIISEIDSGSFVEDRLCAVQYIDVSLAERIKGGRWLRRRHHRCLLIVLSVTIVFSQLVLISQVRYLWNQFIRSKEDSCSKLTSVSSRARLVVQFIWSLCRIYKVRRSSGQCVVSSGDEVFPDCLWVTTQKLSPARFSRSFLRRTGLTRISYFLPPRGGVGSMRG